jgi:putative hydrolase of the HAD superfamily
LAPTFIWFDLGYTLLYNTREEHYRTVLAEYGVEVLHEDLEKAFHVVDKLFMREYPHVFGRDADSYMPWFLGVLNHRLGIRLDLCRAWHRLRELRHSSPRHWVPFPCAHAALEGLKARGLRLGVITNWDHSARHLLEREGLAGFFEQVVVSCEVGAEKPDPRIFEAALARGGVRAAECLYVGDNYYDDAVGARGVGMGALVVNRFGTLGVEEIADVPIIPDISQVARYVG